MDCSLNFPRNGKEFLKAFNRKVSSQRIPLSGTIALTNRCNLNCVHCYLGDIKQRSKSCGTEMDTDRWRRVIDEITEAGCLFLLITGGESLLRNDFPAIYTHAKKNGLLVTLFSNGTLIDQDILDLFSDLPPKLVEITLYGATEKTYEAITRTQGSFKQCMSGINRLKKSKINLRLKTVLLKNNQEEFYAIENLAKNLNLKFRFDANIFPTLAGDKGPVRYRVSARDAVRKEFSNTARSQEWKTVYLRFNEVPETDSLFRCGAGNSLFYINPEGHLHPCLMVSHIHYDLVHGDFRTGWDNHLSTLRTQTIPPDHKCKTCDNKLLCGYCPGFFRLESGSEDIPSDFLCEQGQFRLEKIIEMIEKMKTKPLKGESIGI